MVIAMFGAFGYELDPTKLTNKDKEFIREQIRFFKENRALLQFGTFYRLNSPFEGNDTAWMVVSEDKRSAIVAFYRILAEPNSRLVRLMLIGLNPNLQYCLEETHEIYAGDELMKVGFLLPALYNGTVHTSNTFLSGDFRSKIWKFVAEK